MGHIAPFKEVYMFFLKIEDIGKNHTDQINAYIGLLDTFSPKLGRMTIGERAKSSAWVAEIVDTDRRWKFKRNFLSCNYDYSQANSKGSRGIYKCYFLENDKIYDVSEPVSWKNTARYFLYVENDEAKRITDEEVKKILERRCLDRLPY
jgi:predicted heme/steroid binding protein